MPLKSKVKKLFGRNCILDNFITRKFVDKGSGFSIFRVTQIDWIRPDPDPQHSY